MAFTTVIHLQFGEGNLKSILKFFYDYRDKYLSQSNLKIIIVENNINSLIFKDAELSNFSDLHIIHGDNNFREFSGWTSGLRYLRETLCVVESNIIFSNDTMLEHRAFDKCMKNAFYAGFLDIFSMDIPAMIGDIDPLLSEPPLPEFYAKKYLSTYLFALNSMAAKQIDSLIAPLNISAYFNPKINEDSIFIGKENLNLNYVESIECWLYKKSKRKKWYGHSQLTLLNFNAMKSKATSIMLEHFLSDTLIKKGIVMIDVKNYLHRNFIQEISFFSARKIYSIKWRLKKYLKVLFS